MLMPVVHTVYTHNTTSLRNGQGTIGHEDEWRGTCAMDLLLLCCVFASSIVGVRVQLCHCALLREHQSSPPQSCRTWSSLFADQMA